MRRLDIHVPVGESYDLALRAVKASDPIEILVIPLEQRDRRLISVFIRDENGQGLMDALQDCLKDTRKWRITLRRIEATLPEIDETAVDSQNRARNQKALREEIYADISKGGKLDRDFLLLVIFSTVVAAIGLNSNSVAAVIGAMVIAPLLGPILAFCFAIALGNQKLLLSAGKTLAAGLAVALICSVLLSQVLPLDLTSRELVSRAEVRLDGIALAMAAGAAAALSIARGQSAVLVGVMVAAALLPPGAAIGLFLGAGEWALAFRAGLLLTLNIAALIVAALLIFRMKGIGPRNWLDQKNAQRAVWLNAGVSVVVLIIAIVLIVVLDLGAKIEIGN